MFTENLYGSSKDYLDGTNNATDNSSKALKAALGLGKRIFVTTLVIDNTSAADEHVDILDGSVLKMRVPAPKGTGAVLTFPRPLMLSENTALNFKAVTGVSTITVSFVGFGQ